RNGTSQQEPQVARNPLPICNFTVAIFNLQFCLVRGQSMAPTTTPSSSPARTHTITGGHLVARALRAEGIEAIFTLCGGHIMDIYDGCVDAGIRIVDMRHEQAAGHAADAWTRLTGIPGCAVVTAGPGLTDTVTAVANAWRAQTPMLVIGGQGPLVQAHIGGLPGTGPSGLLPPLTQLSTSGFPTHRLPPLP